MSVFTAAELAYLAEGHLGRLATLGPDGGPHVVPVGVFYDPQRDLLAVGGRGFATSRKFRDVQRDPRVAVVVDDAEATGAGARLRMLEVRGRAEVVAHGGADLRPGFDEPFIRIHPERIVAMGLDHDDRVARGRSVVGHGGSVVGHGGSVVGHGGSVVGRGGDPGPDLGPG